MMMGGGGIAGGVAGGVGGVGAGGGDLAALLDGGLQIAMRLENLDADGRAAPQGTRQEMMQALLAAAGGAGGGIVGLTAAMGRGVGGVGVGVGGGGGIRLGGVRRTGG